MSTELRRALKQVARRFRDTRMSTALALCWFAWALLGAGVWLVGAREGTTLIAARWLLVLSGAAIVTGVACATVALRSVGDARWVARRIEEKHPDLSAALLAAVDEDAATPSGQLGFLQAAVIRQALDHRRTHNWNETVSSWKLRGAHVAHGAALGCLIAVAIALTGQARTQAQPRTGLLAAASVADVDVEPGDTEVERGTPLLVVARFKGGVPAEATLVVDDLAKQSIERSMTRSLEDPTFAGHFESVDSEISYHVRFQGNRTKTFHVRVFEYPELERADARLVFPSYTSLDSKTVEDIRHVTAVEGTELTLNCKLNKEVATARLVDASGQAIELTRADCEQSSVYRATLTLLDPRRFRVELVDRDGRKNKIATEIIANVTRNRPPVVKMTQPTRDTAVSPLEELRLKADLEDDFGLIRQGLSFSMAGREPKEIVLPGGAPKVLRLHTEHMLDFESLSAAPDQLLTYFFWAEDIGPDGQPRRTSGDMFFAEVRPFEEIFRQGEQPPSGSAENEEQEGQQGNARASEQLAELQKEVINATWKLIRRETIARPTAKLVEDAKVVEESQKGAIEQAGRLAERLQDPASKANMGQATLFMKDAVKHLNEVVLRSAVPSLTTALAAEQAAYQALLKLRAREFEVIRRNSRQQRQAGRNSGGNRSQRQLDQLELSNEENRYEEQRTARAQQENLSQQERQQRETGQVLNRLRELGQRQKDVNERLKELQSALEAAKAPPARAEIERQLKRLREQQQQILRDTDELRERMENEDNRDQMADSRQQVDESREHVRQASEAIEQGKIPQALTEGTRAGRQFNDLREELRKKAANRFSDEMTEMREQARRLEENQKKLSEQLDAAKDRPQTSLRDTGASLRDTGDRKKVTQGLDEQRKGVDKLIEQMKQTVQDAEENEPLLAKNLYDTVRKATEQKIPDALKAAEQLTELGVPEDAAKASRHAGQGIEKMREGVERSAKSVLGDGAAALRRAQSELEDLADQVNQEIAQATGQEPSGRPSRNGQRTPQEQGPEREDQKALDPSDPSEMIGPAGDQQKQQAKGAAGQRNGQREERQQPKGKGGRRSQQGQQEKGQQGQQGEQRQQENQQGQGQQGEQGQGQQGQQGQGQQGQGQGQGRNEPADGQQRGQGQRQGLRGDSQRGGPANGGAATVPAGADQRLGGATNGPGRPITGEGFRQWSDRMRDVEELIDDPELRAEAARIRDRARGLREEVKRHAKEPDWTKLKGLVAEPINELRDRITEEVRRRQSPDSLVPIDRDPVPPQFAEGVRRYYERLGSGR
jgi:hypothetical protein